MSLTVDTRTDTQLLRRGDAQSYIVNIHKGYRAHVGPRGGVTGYTPIPGDYIGCVNKVGKWWEAVTDRDVVEGRHFRRRRDAILVLRLAYHRRNA